MRLVRLAALLLALSATLPALADGGRWQKTEDGGCLVWNAVPQEDETASWSGPCVSGKATGEGTLTFRYRLDGNMVEETHTGSYRDGKLEGHAVSRWPNGNTYDGYYVNNLPHGQGVGTYANGSRYEGEWRYGERNGQGLYTWNDGYSYDGAWLGNKPNGYGKMTTGKAEVYSGYWDHGCLDKGGRHAWAFSTKEECGFQ